MWRFQAEGLVLREDEDAARFRIDAVESVNVDDAIESAERTAGWRDRGGAPEAFALASGKE